MSSTRNHSHIVTCSGEDCENSTETDQWTSKRRQREGWFFQRDGSIWCPDHTPKWVEAWRARRNDER